MSVELLAPAGDLFRLKVAFDFGADAVFIGGKAFSLRARASNFTMDDIKLGVEHAHRLGKKLFVTVNIVPHEDNFEGIEEYLRQLNHIKVDAVIVASIAMGRLSKRVAPEMEVHISTQVSAANEHALRFYKACGFDRVVLARECSLEDVQAMIDLDILPIEVFIHGGMCVNVSGRCTLSNHMSLRDANRGGCAQSCRWRYELTHIEDGTIISDIHPSFTMSSKDLNATPHLKALLNMKVASLKIEGRMKSEYYVATIVNAYRHFIDHVDELDEDNHVATTLVELSKAASRATFDGFYGQLPHSSSILYGVNGAGINQDFVGVVRKVEKDRIWVEVRNVFQVNDTLEVFGPHHENRQWVVTDMKNEEHESITRAYQPMSWVSIPSVEPIDENEFIRKVTL
ncbi:MAG: U32 family peptidase [Erysipelotrichia bacterium]|jgi:putative protease|nr:U32 family peptidase [Erysipelotrichia bacterium]